MEDGEVLVEDKQAIMISPNGGNPFKKTGYFLKINGLIEEDEKEKEDGNLKLKLPLMSPKCKWPLKVNFYSWTYPTNLWGKWVESMHKKYHNLWRKCGVNEAILASIHRVHKNEELILNVVDRWCPDTNTFVFPWGEATVSLEDMMILGGFSVLGCCPFSLKEVGNSVKKLKKTGKAFSQWFSCFMGSGSSVEHEAFLAMWLSKFVFPADEIDKINEFVLPIAVHLARGTRIALAPAILAGLYRDLSLLKGTMADASKYFDGEDGDSLEVALWAPMQLVQIWAWERLVPLRPPKANFIDVGDPRVIRWHGIEQEDTINMRPAIDSAGEAFLWRPYALTVDNWVPPMYYRESEEWLPISGKMNYNDNGELESFAKCLRVCKLRGVDCEELYQPHRVAMQFGYDQDIPKWISRSNEFLEFAWYRPFDTDAFLFLPSRLVEADLSYKYMEWWRNTVLVPTDSIPGMKRRARKGRRRKSVVRNRLKGNSEGGIHPVKIEPGMEPYDLSPPPGFPPKGNLIDPISPGGFPRRQVETKLDVLPPPPGFLTKRNIADLISPPGFPQRKIVTTVNVLPPPGFASKQNLADSDYSPLGSPLKRNKPVIVIPPPPGFLPKRNMADPITPAFPRMKIETTLDVLPPPGFPARQNVPNSDYSPPASPLIRRRHAKEDTMHIKASYAGGSGSRKSEHVI